MTGVACSSVIITWAFIANTFSKSETDFADKKLKRVWIMFKPFLFPLIGASVLLTELPFSTFLKCLGLVCMSMLIKALTAFLTSYFCHLELEECIFISGTWAGKASVQATLCSAALEMVHLRSMKGQIEEEYAKIVFMSMVSAILLGGPFAGLWVSYFGKKAVGLAKHIEVENT
jgi:Kef-type K+ transport system membrane component KefB